MRILVTGHRGNVGVPAARRLAGLGYDVAGLDRVDGDDVLDLGQVTRAAAGAAAVVHLAALAHDSAGRPEQIMAVNVLGTWHALAAQVSPGVPVNDPARYRADPWRSLVDWSAAETLLGWRPRYRWPGRGDATHQRSWPGRV